ncbi:hypothetical protein BCR37DRAFT_170518 [Protomyces lactucae-debilis]|uniref:J domain-containing protein n=1 Tax=Protomyces lactucae-debilis TaxID=2754530 RepID=A0A1Y2EVW5_PROLT|nr:uncharacterized protein BCR37DRAFT_170518 [Protomyces lactucae-debilis]ORY75752.1 hypothetical protein BCR37DRAFT_170518 [Protomyces lactucae-debilis]
MSQAILNFIGWAVLPNLATSTIHNLLFKSPLSPSLPGTVGYARDRRLIYIAVVVSYLAYTVYQATSSLSPNYYTLLGVQPGDVDEKVLRRQFRKLSQIHHPDKGGDEAEFRVLRQAYDALSNPVVKFGYDRFGAAAAGWEEKTMLGMMQSGVYASLPFYVGSLIFVVGIGAIQQNAYGTYWRGLCLVGLGCIHASLVCAQSRFPIFAKIASHRVQFEHVTILQSLLVTVLSAIAQVGPVLVPQTRRDDSDEAWEQLVQMAALVRQEGSLALHLQVVPFLRGSSKMRSLMEQGARWMMRAKLDAEPEIVDAKRQANQVPGVVEQTKRTFQV